SSIGGTIRRRFKLFKLDNTSLKSEYISTSVNPLMAELIEVYATKRKKDNTRKAVEVSDPLEKGNTEPKNNEELKRKMQVNGELMILILDSRSLGCVVSASFFKKAGILIDYLSTIMMIGMYGKQKRLLGKINQILVTIRTKTITSKAIVTKAANYAIIIPTEYYKLANIGDQIIKKKGKKVDNKDADEENESESREKEEIDSDNESETMNCILQKDPNDWTICHSEEIRDNRADARAIGQLSGCFVCELAQLGRTTIV
ncbi:4367_t:CDS:2, partial [Gigaspora margarita]